MALRNTLLRSLSSAFSPEKAEARRQELASIPNPARRATTLVLHHLATEHPVRVAKVLGVTKAYEERQRMTYVGNGFYSDVYLRPDNTVVKINRFSQLMTAAERRSFAARGQDAYEKLANYMGAFTVPQQTIVDRHPVDLEQEALQIIQPYVIGESADFAETGLARRVIMDRLRDAQSRTSADLLDQLHRFTTAGYALYEDYGMLPDTVGAHNLLITPAGQLTLVDGQPTSPLDADAQAQTLQQLHAFKNICEVGLVA